MSSPENRWKIVGKSNSLLSEHLVHWNSVIFIYDQTNYAAERRIHYGRLEEVTIFMIRSGVNDLKVNRIKFQGSACVVSFRSVFRGFFLFWTLTLKLWITFNTYDIYINAKYKINLLNACTRQVN
jgi:hypothetical protein